MAEMVMRHSVGGGEGFSVVFGAAGLKRLHFSSIAKAWRALAICGLDGARFDSAVLGTHR